MAENTTRHVSLNRVEELDRSKSNPVAHPIATAALYHYRAIIGATVLGSPIAGAVLMAVNYRRLGKPIAAAAVLVGGFALVALILLMTSGATLEVQSKASAFGVATMALVAKLLQRKYVQEHVSTGGSLASGWDAFGIALVCLILIV